MARRIIDISVPLENGVRSDPDIFRPKIKYLGHKDTLADLAAFFPGLKPEDMPDGEAWALEHVELITHNGTHLDAPYHFHSTMDRGKRSLTIDEIDLNWCFQPGVKLDFRHIPDGAVATAEDVEKELLRIKHDLQPLEIVLVNTRAGERYGHEDYLTAGCGVGREATLHLLNRRVRITGTDAWSWDAPFEHTRENFLASGDASLIWEGHKTGREIGYCHLEKLHNLESLPPDGFQVCCLPVKIKDASAGWTRAVVLMDDKT